MYIVTCPWRRWNGANVFTGEVLLSLSFFVSHPGNCQRGNNHTKGEKHDYFHRTFTYLPAGNFLSGLFLPTDDNKISLKYISHRLLHSLHSSLCSIIASNGNHRNLPLQHVNTQVPGFCIVIPDPADDTVRRKYPCCPYLFY